MPKQPLPRLTWTIGLTVLFSIILLTAPAVFADSGAVFISPAEEDSQRPRAIPWRVGPATALEIGGVPTQTVAGASLALTVTLRDGVGDIATEYTGTVTFASSDPQATLLATYTYSTSDAGRHLFSGLVLRTAGTQMITATDINSPALQSVVTINVVPGTVSAGLSQLRVTSPHRADGNATATIMLTATDAYSNPAPAQIVWLAATGVGHTFA